MKKLALFLPLLAWLLAGCTPAVKPQLGFFYNEDGTFSPGFDSIRQPQGIVFDMKAGLTAVGAMFFPFRSSTCR